MIRLKLLFGIYDDWHFEERNDCYISSVDRFIEAFNYKLLNTLATAGSDLTKSQATRVANVINSLDQASRDALLETFKEHAKKPIIYR